MIPERLVKPKHSFISRDRKARPLSINKEESMEQQFPLTHCYNSVPEDEFIMIGCDGAKGDEKPGDRHYLNMKVAVTACGDDPRLKQGEVYSLQLGLTTEQVAHIVKYFFEDTVRDWSLDRPTGNVFGNMLRRLLVRRWKTMSNPIYKDRIKAYTTL